MNEGWQKRLLLVAATWNMLGGITALVNPAKRFALFAGGSGTNGLFAAGVVDGLFAIFFVAAFLAIRAKSAASK